MRTYTCHLQPISHFRYAVLSTLLATSLIGCTPFSLLPNEPTMAFDAVMNEAQVVVEWTDFSAKAACADQFIIHPVDHATTIQGNTVHLYDSNGSGLAINDLDNDGDLDIVLGNLAGMNTILWNQGGLTFSNEKVHFGQTRAINIVDFDGDGWQDIFFARQQKRPILWRNLGISKNANHPAFEEVKRPGVWVKAFATSWADLDKDNDLDLVAASYDTEYTKDNPGAAGGGGVALFDNQVAQTEVTAFESTSLAFEAQALALILEDINHDGAIDILVGNDFFLHDQVWLRQGDSWQTFEPFVTMSMNTMSFAAADLNNDGQAELFAGDMLPYQPDDEVLARWAPVVGPIEPIPNDPQVMANVLHQFDSDGLATDQAPLLGIKAAGWSWSAQFGDLNNDGLLDLYIVNGMNAKELFGHLPNNELVEENLAFRNTADGRFVPAPEWGLNSTDGGRSMAMADLDQDGDLDIVVNNLLAPAQIFENRLCSGRSLLVDLHWSGSQNSRAIGAEVALHTEHETYYRSVRAASGYLTGVPSQIHFGFPQGEELDRLEVTWPDGKVSIIDRLKPEMRLEIVRQVEIHP